MTQAELKGNIKSVLRAACRFCAPLFRKKTEISSKVARSILENCASKPAGTSKASNRLTERSCDLQIIVPAYNQEDYLERCMESILNQKTKYSFHVILVDDGSNDNTPEICDRYADHPLVTVIHQKNRGHAGARNRALEALFGEYVMFVDSDDILCPGAIEALLDTAHKLHSDIVEGGAYYLVDGKRTIMHRYPQDREIKDPYDVLHGQPWAKVYRRELWEKLCLPEGYWYEDSVISFLVYSLARRISVCSHMVYEYRINRQGIVKTSVGKPRSVETYWITELLLQEHKEAKIPVDEAFFGFLLVQIRLNQLRLSDLEEKIQEAAFVLTCDLVTEYFPERVRSGREKNLVRALETRDFGMFRMCCKFF